MLAHLAVPAETGSERNVASEPMKIVAPSELRTTVRRVPDASTGLPETEPARRVTPSGTTSVARAPVAAIRPAETAIPSAPTRIGAEPVVAPCETTGAIPTREAATEPAASRRRGEVMATL